ncbi:MAG: hypothetical protein ACPIGE_06265 [Parvibaculales bacterium]
MSAANAGTLEITECSLTDFAYTYSVENGATAIIQLGSISDENVTLEPSTVDSGNGSNTHDLSDDMPDGNVYVTLVDGDEITTRICSDANAEEASGQ